MEVGLVFNKQGELLYWHVPTNRSVVAIPDSRDLWEVLWRHRAVLGGVAHTHPFSGFARPSSTDVTTFAAIEQGLGRRLIWPVVTFVDVGYFTWAGPGEHDYLVLKEPGFRVAADLIHQLRELSRIEGGLND